MDEIIDAIATDESPAGISQSLKDLIYQKAAERVEGLRPAASAAILITRKTAAGATIGSCTVNTKETVLLSKDPTDTLTAASNGASVLVAQIAYQN